MRFLIPLLFTISSIAATTTNYVDPDFTGSQLGTASSPWSNITSAAWSTINSELSNGPVTVYFSARKASSDVNQVYDTVGNGIQLPIDLNQKTNNSGFLLTLDGKSFYNSNDSTPSWIPYSGASMCVVQYFDSENSSHIKRSDITVHGFNIVCNANTKIVTICGDNFTLEQCDCSQTSIALSGPGVLIVPTADGIHDGSSSYAPVCTNINIISNNVHDTSGEAIYLGGGGSSVGTAGSGYPSHGGITVAYNKVHVAGEWAGQGDGIDIKGGLYNVVIRGNEVYSLIYTGAIRGLVCQGQTNGATGVNTLIEKNYFHDCTAVSDACIRIADTWGVPQGVVIRNNIFANIDGPGSSGQPTMGIIIDSTQDQLIVENNTIFHCSGWAMGDGVSNCSVRWRNNLLLNNNSNGTQVTFKSSATNDSDYNAFNNTWGFAGEGAHTISVSTSALVNVGAEDFHVAVGSPLIDSGQTQAGFSDDFSGTTRPQGAAWDIGAYEYKSSGPPIFSANSFRVGRIIKSP